MMETHTRDPLSSENLTILIGRDTSSHILPEIMRELNMDTQNKWVGIVEAAQAVGISRNSLDHLKRLTKPTIATRMDPTSAHKNKILYRLDAMTEWLNFHLKLNAQQSGRLADAGRVILPSVTEAAYG
jgi:hypothetical protein